MKTVEEINTAAVLGAGTMGHGIAQVLAMCGIETRLFDVAQEPRDVALTRVTANLDRAMTQGRGSSMGPLRLTDLVGLDVRLSIAEYLAREFGAHYEPPTLLHEKVAQGELGKESGQVFYAWKSE